MKNFIPHRNIENINNNIEYAMCFLMLPMFLCGKINIKLNHDTFIHYHDWLPEKFDFKKIIKNINIKFSFCFIRNPIDIFYSSFYWCKDESIITSFLFKTIDSTTDINIDINDVNNPHDLIDYLDNHQKEIVLNEFFINKISFNF